MKDGGDLANVFFTQPVLEKKANELTESKHGVSVQVLESHSSGKEYLLNAVFISPLHVLPVLGARRRLELLRLNQLMPDRSNVALLRPACVIYCETKFDVLGVGFT